MGTFSGRSIEVEVRACQDFHWLRCLLRLAFFGVGDTFPRDEMRGDSIWRQSCATDCALHPTHHANITTMSLRVSPAVTSSMFNRKCILLSVNASIDASPVTSLLQSLPSRSQSLTKCSACLFSTTAPLEAKRAKKRKARKHIDPYRLAQARQRKSANMARQKVLQEERSLALGDPVRSRPTPFVQSLRANAPTETVRESYLNYFLKKEDVKKSLEYSKWLTEPLPEANAVPGVSDNLAERIQKHAASHENASKALLAIASLENAGSKDRTRINVQRCIGEFGRHNTDQTLPPRLQSKQSPGISSTASTDATAVEGPRRIGQDTGSSEVQIAILTAKINVLADNLHKKDKSNKRSLRLMVHRRQKLMAYLRRQDRGGPRWQNIVEKLGLSDAMWKEEISL